MSPVVDPESEPTEPQRPLVRALQMLGAGLVTLFALWFLFGIPAYLLFGTFFG